MKNKFLRTLAGVALSAAMVLPTAAYAAESIAVSPFRAEQSGDRVYVYENDKQIFRTNGAGNNGTLQALFVVDGSALVVVEHYKKGLQILADADSGVINAAQVGTLGAVDSAATADGFSALQKDARVYVYNSQGKQIFRTNGAGDNGQLMGMFSVNGNAYIIVKHYKKGLMVLGDADTGVISAKQVATVEIQ